jgi:beta-glucosidase
MTLRILAVLSLCAPLALHAQRPRATPPDARVEALLRRMTLEEKVGEMTQIDITAVTRVPGSATRAPEIDSVKLEDIVVKHNVGSLLNVPGVAPTPSQWVDITAMIQRFVQRKRLHTPVIYGIDAVHGHQFMVGGTIFPQNIAMAATWNPLLVRRANEITAYEIRASGIAWNFSPVLDLARQPLWSRVFETFGEDVHLATVLGVASVLGEQEHPIAAADSLLGGKTMTMMGPMAAWPSAAHDFGSLSVAATAKHFLGYSMPLSGRDRTSAWIPERQLRELFVPTFRAAIGAGVRTVMVNSGEINGVPVHASKELLTDLLRTELGFRGVVVSDWEDIIRLQTVHHVAKSRREAVRMSIDAGIDMSMVPLSTSYYDDLLALVRAGEVKEARINESVRRILKLKFDLGLFERPGADAARLANANAPAFRAVSRRAAEEAVTLLKNERGLLPLDRGARILVTGPGATSLSAQHGGWTYTWQGADTSMYPKSVATLLAALRSQFGEGQVTYSPGATFTSDAGIAAAVEAARQADIVIVALAEGASAEKPGDVDDLALPDAQLRLARAMEATGKPVVLTLFEGRPRTVHDVVDGARAIVLGYLPGPYGGEAIARVLAGEVNPSGRLPYTYPRNASVIEHYDHTNAAEIPASREIGGYNPEWDFGFGLSYTTFAYDTLQIAKRSLRANDTIMVSVAVTNTGKRAGMEVVQLYVRQAYASVVPPVRRLRDFEKISLEAGERRVVTFRVPVQRLAFVGRNNKLVVEPGDFELQIGGRKAGFVVQ